MNSRGGKDPCDRPNPNSEDLASEIDLTETYGDLPPGNYSLVGGACLDGSGARSNPVLMTIARRLQGESSRLPATSDKIHYVKSLEWMRLDRTDTRSKDGSRSTALLARDFA